MHQYEAAASHPRLTKPVNPNFAAEADTVSSPLSQRIGFALLAFLIWLMSTAFIVVIPGLFLLPYMASQGIALDNGVAIADFAKNDPTAVILQLAAIVPAHLLTVVLAWAVITQGKKYSFLQTFGMGHGGIVWWHYVAIIVGFFIIAAAVQSVMPEQDNDLIRILRSSRTAAILIAFVATFSAPFVEELIYRGVLYSAFTRAFGVPISFLLVTLLFALVHVPQYYPSYSTILLLTLLSVTLTGLRVYSKSLLPCIILHTIFNGLQSAIILIEPMISEPQAEGLAGIVIKLN